MLQDRFDGSCKLELMEEISVKYRATLKIVRRGSSGLPHIYERSQIRYIPVGRLCGVGLATSTALAGITLLLTKSNFERPR